MKSILVYFFNMGVLIIQTNTPLNSFETSRSLEDIKKNKKHGAGWKKNLSTLTLSHFGSNDNKRGLKNNFFFKRIKSAIFKFCTCKYDFLFVHLAF